MSDEIYRYLLISNLLHFVFSLFLVMYMRFTLENRNNSHARYYSKRLTTIALICLISDMLSYVFDRQTFFGANVLNYVTTAVAIFTTAYVGYYWNRFFDIVYHIHSVKVKTRKSMYLLPMIMLVALLAVNVFTGWFFTLGEENVYHRGILSPLSFILQYLPFALLTFRALFFKFSVKTIRYAKLRNSFLWIGTTMFVFGLLQYIFGGEIALQNLGLTAGVFVMFIRFQDDQITNDLLTGLNNRYALESYVEDKIKNYDDGSHAGNYLYLLMMDVNYFKDINDEYGHLEGDRALKSVAGSLKKIGARHGSNLFLARFGGDEFAAVYETQSEDAVEKLCRDIKETVLRDSKSLGYRLSIGTGYSLYGGKSTKLSSFYDQADKALYVDKKSMKGEEQE